MSDLILEIVEGPEAGQQLPLTQAVEAGRSADAGLTLSDDQASRHHARLEPSGGGAVVTDLDSSNGTYVNEQPISGRPRRCAPGDRVRIGLSVLELRDRAAVAAQPSAVRQLPPFAAPGAEGLGVAAASNTAAVGDDYAALAALVDTNVKRQTGVATFALLARGRAGGADLLRRHLSAGARSALDEVDDHRRGGRDHHRVRVERDLERGAPPSARAPGWARAWGRSAGSASP